MNAGKDITALLKLNASGFDEGLSNAISSLQSFKTKFTKETEAVEKALNQLPLIIDRTSEALQHLDSIANLSQFSKLSEAINKLANGLKILSSESVDVSQGMAVINTIFEQMNGVANSGRIEIRGLASALRELRQSESSVGSSSEQVKGTLETLKSSFNSSYASAEKFGKSLRDAYLEEQRQKENLEMLTREYNRLAMAIQQSANAEQREAQASEQVAMAEEKQSVATDKATNSMNRQTTATNRLGKAMSSLRMIGTMVASMMVYNFAHNLIQATRETVNAKSEMNGYFQMLGYTSSEIDHFNGKLDQMIQKFPRINKYALGETISSIGVEFELTTKEMEKAMPVVSMITSEYLRAGRNVNEASLAVKDILQGEFQRLSRETGVKGDQLKEAGWSGDKTDVMGLLEALDKVGKSRNWDVFVAKANSLNDAVMILQNRFGEWSADMVERVQPTILSVFNDIMVVATSFGKVINGVLDWLSGDGIGQNIVKWTGLGIAIANVTTGLIAYRTGANLTQIAQMGLTKSIGASVLGLEAEAVAEHGLRNSIVMTISGLEAETLAEELNISTRRARWVAIMSTVTGLEAETVAELGLTKSLFASLFALDSATLKEEGFLVALGSATTGIEVQEFALMSYRTQLALTVGSIGLVAGALVVLTGYFAVNIAKVNDSIDNYNKFRNTIDKGQDIIDEYKGTVDSLTEKKQELSDKLETLDKNSYKYALTQDKLKTVTDDLTVANQNYTDSVNAVAWANHKQDLYDTSKQETALNTQKEINKALIDSGVSVKTANEMASPIWQDTIDGWNQQYETLQGVNEQYKKNANTVTHYLDEMQKKKIDPKEVEVLIKPLIKSGNKIADAKEQLGQATSLTEYVDKWLWLQYREIEHSINEFNLNWEIDDPDTAFEGLFKGFGIGLEKLKLPFPEFTSWITNQIKGWINFDGLNLETLPTTAIGTSISNWLESEFKKNIEDKTLMEILGLDENKDYIGDLFKWITDSISKGLSDLGNWLSSLPDLDLFAQWLTDIGVGIQDYILDWWNNFTSFKWLSIDGFDFDIWSIFGLDTVSASDGSSDHPSFMEDLSNIIGVDVQTWITNFNSDPLGTLGIQLPPIDIMGLINPLIPTVGNGGFDIGGWLSSLFNIDGIVSTFTTNLQTIFTTASTIATNVGNIFSNLRSIIWGHISNIITNVTNGFNTVKDNAVSKINQLKDGVSGAIDKVKSAFITMKDSILNSAKLIYDGVKEKFDGVKNTIGDFWNKLTNPSSWGSAGSESYQRRSPKPQTARRMFSPVVRSATHHGAGVNPYQNDSQTVRLKDLMDMVNGDNKVRLSDFLAMFSSGGFGAWDFHEPSKTRIFDTAKNYKTGSPNIRGIGTVGDGYYVSKFWDGKPKFSFDEFLAVAQAIFSAIPYKFYYDSEWKGNWVNALLSGATNCYDGSMALLSLARVFGFGGNLVHTNLKNGVGHFYVNIAGRNLDTTNFQNHGSWSPLGGAGIPTRTASYRGNAGETQGKTVNITVSMDNAVIYGVDDLDSRIQDSVQKGIQSEFNDPYTVAI